MKQGWAIQQARSLQPPPQSDEVFILPDSDDIDLDEDDGQVANEHFDQSSQNHDSSDDGQAKSPESPGSNVHMDYLADSFACGSHIVYCILSIYNRPCVIKWWFRPAQ